MKLEEAKEFSLKKMICRQSQIPFLRLLNKIYDDFKLELEAEYKRGWEDRATQSDLESRTCDNCAYRGDTEAECTLLIYILETSLFDTSSAFACNKWLQK